MSIQYNPEDKEILGRNVWTIRKAKKQTQAEFAKNCGISQKTLYKIEKGVHIPKIIILVKIAVYAGCETRQLFDANTKDIFENDL